MNDPNVILLTGATGYVGGRLLDSLEQKGRRIRCLARRPEHLRHRVGETTEVAPGDVLDPGSLPEALRGVRAAYYLIHSMGASRAFEERDRQGARNFAAAARAAGVERIIYLGGLGGSDARLSPHLRSRQEVGDLLRSSGVPVIEFRASIILGSGSLSFEMIRALVERLPVMVTPRWVSIPAQPIAIRDVLSYLVAALDCDAQGSPIFQIGGADRVSYGDIMTEYARQRGLRRWMIPVPFLTPRLSGLWLGLVTPIYARVGRSLIDGVRNPTVVTDDRAARAFPIRPLGLREAIAATIRVEDEEFAVTRWSDALAVAGPLASWGGARFGSRFVASRAIQCAASPGEVFAVLQRIGGKTGWYFGNWLWRLRGALDLLVGGVGLRRGRSRPHELRVGDTIDVWRIEAVTPGRFLRLAAEMKLPGRAWLQFEIDPAEEGCMLRQTAIFDPVGLGGQLYWYGLLPVHEVVFRGMLRSIASRAARHHPR